MADIVRELAAKLGLDFQAGEFLKAELAFEGIKKAAELLFGSVQNVVNALAQAVVSTAQEAAHLNDLGKRTGIAVEDLQELEYAAKRSGSSAEDLGAGLRIMGGVLAAASAGSKQAMDAFGALGVSIRDGNGQVKDAQQLFLEISDRVAQMPPGLARTAAVMGVFGKAGSTLTTTLAEGSEGIRVLREEIRDLGGVMSEDMVRQAAAVDDVLNMLRTVSRGLAHDFAGPFLEAIRDVSGAFFEWFKRNRSIIRTGIDRFARALVLAFQALGKALAVVARYWDALLIALGSLALAILLNTVELGALTVGFIKAGIAAVVAGAQAAAAWLAAAAPVAVMAALIALIALAAEDVFQFLTGGDSLIGDLGPKWTKFLEEFTRFGDEDPWWLQVIKAGVKGLTDLTWALDQFKSAWTLFDSSFQLGGAAGALQTLGRALIPGFGTQGVDVSFDPSVGFRASPSLPSMTASAPGRGSVNNTVNVPINVQVGPGTSPHEVARVVGEAVDERMRSHLQDAAAATE